MCTSNNSSQPRLGFLGGTFDPPHNGHLQIAQLAIREASLDKLLLCPAYHAPLKADQPFFNAQHRLGMVRSICIDRPNLEVYDAEIKYGKRRFSYETIGELKDQFPGYQVFFILGADQFSRLHDWKNVSQLAQSVHFLVFARQKKNTKIPNICNLQFSIMDNDLINISSTDIRNHILSKRLPVNLLPPEVTTYMRTQNLFSPEIIPTS